MYTPTLASYASYFEQDEVQTDGPDLMGTVCRVHQCARFMDEVPVLAGGHSGPLTSSLKRNRFPHSWNFVHTNVPAGRHSRVQAKRTTMVRYCPECREAMVKWMNERAYTASAPAV